MQPHRLLVILTAALLATGGASADTVFFTNGNGTTTSMQGKVVSLGKEIKLYVNGNENMAAVWENADNIRVELDYDSRLKALKADDWQGHYGLGLWCEKLIGSDREMRARALERFNYCKKYVEDEVYRHLGDIYRGLSPATDGTRRLALENYREYLKNHPEDQTVKDLVSALEKELPVPAAEKDGEDKTENGDEELEFLSWQCQSWGNQGRTRLVKDKANNENQTLEITVNPSGKDKGAFLAGINRDCRQYDYISFDAYNPQPFPVKVWAALISGSKGIWYEQNRAFTIPAGQWKTGMKINFRTNYWKGFEGSTAKGNNLMPELSPVRSILFLLGNHGKPYTLYLDNIVFRKNAPAAQ